MRIQFKDENERLYYEALKEHERTMRRNQCEFCGGQHYFHYNMAGFPKVFPDYNGTQCKDFEFEVNREMNAIKRRFGIEG